MNNYRFYFRSGHLDEGKGHDVADAFRRLGYGGGAIRALDFYEEIDEGPSEFAWDVDHWHNFVLFRGDHSIGCRLAKGEKP